MLNMNILFGLVLLNPSDSTLLFPRSHLYQIFLQNFYRIFLILFSYEAALFVNHLLKINGLFFEVLENCEVMLC